MSKLKNSGRLDQYGAECFEQLQFGTAGGKGLSYSTYSCSTSNWCCSIVQWFI